MPCSRGAPPPLSGDPYLVAVFALAECRFGRPGGAVAECRLLLILAELAGVFVDLTATDLEASSTGALTILCAVGMEPMVPSEGEGEMGPSLRPRNGCAATLGRCNEARGDVLPFPGDGDRLSRLAAVLGLLVSVFSECTRPSPSPWSAGAVSARGRPVPLPGRAIVEAALDGLPETNPGLPNATDGTTRERALRAACAGDCERLAPSFSARALPDCNCLEDVAPIPCKARLRLKGDAVTLAEFVVFKLPWVPPQAGRKTGDALGACGTCPPTPVPG